MSRLQAGACAHAAIRVRYDSHQEKAFVVEKPNGTERWFVKTNAGLYCFDTAEHGTVLVNTVDDSKSRYPVCAYRQAVLARKLQTMTGYPSTRDFIKLVDKNLIPNCPIGRADILAAKAIFGPNVNTVKGKTVCHGELHVKSDVSPIPREILSLYRNVTLCVNIMYVNKLPFLLTISRNIKFATIKLLANRLEETIWKCVSNVMRLYGSRGFLVNMLHADGEFEMLRRRLSDAKSDLNVYSNAEHVPKV
jgi:hypothetical protein